MRGVEFPSYPEDVTPRTYLIVQWGLAAYLVIESQTSGRTPEAVIDELVEWYLGLPWPNEWLPAVVAVVVLIWIATGNLRAALTGPSL